MSNDTNVNIMITRIDAKCTLNKRYCNYDGFSELYTTTNKFMLKNIHTSTENLLSFVSLYNSLFEFILVRENFDICENKCYI